MSNYAGVNHSRNFLSLAHHQWSVAGIRSKESIALRGIGKALCDVEMLVFSVGGNTFQKLHRWRSKVLQHRLRHLHQKLHRRRRKVLQHRRRRKVLQHRAARALCARRSTRCSLGVTSARSSRPLGGSTQSQLASRGSRLARRECQRHHRHHRLRHLHQTLHRWRSKVLQHPLRHLHQKLHRRRRTIAKTCLCR